jgi:hypothetical protein
MWNLVSFIFFGVLGIYFDNVLPQKFGVRKAPWFFFLPSYWGCMRHKKKDPADADVNDEETIQTMKNYEDVPDHLLRLKDENEVLEIRNLKKVFN